MTNKTSSPPLHVSAFPRVSVLDFFIPGFTGSFANVEQLLPGGTGSFARLLCIFGVALFLMRHSFQYFLYTLETHLGSLSLFIFETVFHSGGQQLRRSDSLVPTKYTTCLPLGVRSAVRPWRSFLHRSCWFENKTYRGCRQCREGPPSLLALEWKISFHIQGPSALVQLLARGEHNQCHGASLDHGLALLHGIQRLRHHS